MSNPRRLRDFPRFLRLITVVIEDSQFRILHDGTQVATHPRTVIKEITRRSASGHINYKA